MAAWTRSRRPSFMRIRFTWVARGFLDDERGGDLAVRQAPSEELKNLPLTRCQLIELGLIGKLGSGLLRQCGRSRIG